MTQKLRSFSLSEITYSMPWNCHVLGDCLTFQCHVFMNRLKNKNSKEIVYFIHQVQMINLQIPGHKCLIWTSTDKDSAEFFVDFPPQCLVRWFVNPLQLLAAATARLRLWWAAASPNGSFQISLRVILLNIFLIDVNNKRKFSSRFF